MKGSCWLDSVSAIGLFHEYFSKNIFHNLKYQTDAAIFERFILTITIIKKILKVEEITIFSKQNGSFY